jgi:hypothetical protein
MTRTTMTRWIAGVSVFVLLFAGGSARMTAQPQMVLIYTPVTELTVGDLDFKIGGSHSLFFTLNITSPQPRRVKLHGNLDIVLADGESFPGAATLTTKPFTIPKIISNLDIGPGRGIQTESFEFSSDAKSHVEDPALSTGKLPSGTYTLTLWITDSTGPAHLAEPRQPVILNLRTLTRLDLISPPDNSTLPNPFPQFNWQYDGDRVEFSVYEWLPSKHTKEDAADGTPQLIVRSGDPLLPVGARAFTYPSGGVRSLEPGKTYVWRVRGMNLGSGGAGTAANSTIWQFTVASAGGNISSGGENGTLALQLLNLGLAAQILNGLLSGDLVLTGVMMIDGVPVSAEEVERILRDLAANPDKIISIKYVE